MIKLKEVMKISRLRLKLFFLFVGVFSLLFQLGSYSTVTEDEANEFMDLISEQIKGIDGIGIAFHNLQISKWI